MNLLTVNCQGNHALVGDFKLPLPDGLTGAQRIVLGIRPEDVHLAQPEDTQTLQGQVFLVENLGMHNLVSVRVKGQQANPITIRALLPVDQTWSEAEVSLALPPESIHWFDVETGNAVGRHG